MDTIRIGRISSVNYAEGTARVVYTDRDNSVTMELPLLSYEYSMPKVDDLVLVLHLPTGGEAGVILGKFWNDNNKPKESGEKIYRKDLGEGCYIKYDEETKKLRIDCPKGIQIRGNIEHLPIPDEESTS